jgi:hypothetical protein
MAFFQSDLKLHIPYKFSHLRKIGNQTFAITWSGIYKSTAEKIAKNLEMDGDIIAKIVKIRNGWAIFTRYTYPKKRRR